MTYFFPKRRYVAKKRYRDEAYDAVECLDKSEVEPDDWYAIQGATGWIEAGEKYACVPYSDGVKIHNQRFSLVMLELALKYDVWG